MTQAMVNSVVLGWAVERSKMELPDLADRLNINDALLSDWLSGKKRPTFKQAQKLANVLSVPFGYLFLDAPPEEQIPVPDFRTVGSRRARISPNTRDLLRDIQFKREWYADYLQRNFSEDLDFVGKFNLKHDADMIAADMRKVLFEFDSTLFVGKLNAPTFLNKLMAAVEAMGVWVMRSGIVKNDTHRPLDVSDLRGFAIADKRLPVIFINGADAIAAQVFTMAHELAHLWVGSSDLNSIDLGEADFGSIDMAEVKCNKIAAEFLVPRTELLQLWKQKGEHHQIDNLAYHFGVSRAVLARRAFDLGLLTRSDFEDFYSAEQERWKSVKRSPGGNFYNTVPARNGRAFTSLVVREAMRGNLLLREASNLLGVKPAKLKNIPVVQ